MPTPFTPYSPTLPPSINYALLLLMQEAVAPATPEEERAQLELNRALAFDLLHRHFESRTHERARAIIKEAWERQGPFCLYLRNFALGGVNTEPFDDAEETLEPGGGNVLTIASMADVRLQIALAKHVAARVPVVGVENPSYDSRGGNTLPKLSLSDVSWRAVVRKLIAAAECIILFYDRPSAGVSIELDMIRRARRQPATVVVLPSGELSAGLEFVNSIRERAADVLTSGLDEPISFDKPGESNEVKIEGPPDFPVGVRWDESPRAVRLLKDAIVRLPPQKGHVRFSKRAPVPRAPGPPKGLKDWAEVSGTSYGILAADEITKGDLTRAEDLLAARIAVSFWGDDLAARSDTFLWLGYVQLCQGKLQYAVENMERALDILERSPADAAYRSGMLRDMSSDLEQYREHRRVRALLKRISRLPSGSKARPNKAPEK